MEEIRNIIVIGASAGGIQAIRQLLSGIPADIDAAFFVVIHMSRKSNGSVIAKTFQKNTSLICNLAAEGTVIQKGHLYVARPDHHMMIKDQILRINQGPHENKYRPSIDVLFRSAAVNYGNRVIGIILTGLLDDGTSGMSAIKKTGGICIVQDPTEAEYSDMPQSVLNQIDVDYQAHLAQIPAIIEQIMDNPLPPVIPVPAELKIEADLTENMMSDINDLKKIADHSDFICPDCGGGLWAIKNDLLHRYRCHTGHVYTERILYDEQGENIEESIWVCIRMLEERRNLLSLMSKHAQEDGDYDLMDSHKKRGEEIEKHIARLKSVLAKLTEDLEPPEVD